MVANPQTESEAEEQAGKLIEQFRKENPGLEGCVPHYPRRDISPTNMAVVCPISLLTTPTSPTQTR